MVIAAKTETGFKIICSYKVIDPEKDRIQRTKTDEIDKFLENYNKYFQIEAYNCEHLVAYPYDSDSDTMILYKGDYRMAINIDKFCDLTKSMDPEEFRNWLSDRVWESIY